MLPELPPLKEVVKRYSLTPQRSRGQHFLFDSNITDRIANTAELSEKLSKIGNIYFLFFTRPNSL